MHIENFIHFPDILDILIKQNELHSGLSEIFSDLSELIKVNFQGRRYLIADRDGAWAWMSAGSIVFGLNVIVMYISIYSSNCKAKQQYFQRIY